MPYSTCPYCGKRSYSAATMEEWSCPYCHKKVVEKTGSQDDIDNIAEKKVNLKGQG